MVYNSQSGSKHHNASLSNTLSLALRVSYKEKKSYKTDLHHVQACQEMFEGLGIEEPPTILFG
jgi:hypothetical protein